MLDYRIAYSRQSLAQEGEVFRELDFNAQYDPGELHRKLSRQLTHLGYRVGEENLGIVRRPVGEHVGDVLGILHGISDSTIPNAGVIIHGILKNQYLRTLLYETHLKVSLAGEYYPNNRVSNMSVIISGRVNPLEMIPSKVLQTEKSRWLLPHAQQSYSTLRNKLELDVASLAAFVQAQSAPARIQ